MARLPGVLEARPGDEPGTGPGRRPERPKVATVRVRAPAAIGP
ncbi:hypothetical protein Tbis_1785 [Thermobispora bispora DSM 43833]|uniref:Uncharacterized protein n=1 Tax=Thermobispora bispora (strain ATCC 19993 / DSM 43833 / CBS 139.67 / JCM 10125 / KCTC 9307 / NBRC 14880 / R51) TaxID=469371 RepID=D6YBD7_THEBD|nr:hypothetical protein Tbis_1785 [Thermobispora bispora DSM 43833]